MLQVNSVSLRGVSHEQAISLLRRTPSKVRLLIYRDVNLQLSLLDPTQIYNIFNIDVVKKPGRGTRPTGFRPLFMHEFRPWNLHCRAEE